MVGSIDSQVRVFYGYTRGTNERSSVKREASTAGNLTDVYDSTTFVLVADPASSFNMCFRLTYPNEGFHSCDDAFAEGQNARVVESGIPGAGGSETSGAHESRIWWSKPHCWREDKQGSAGASVSIACEGVSTDYVASRRTLHTTRRPKALKDRLESFLARRVRRLPTIAERVAAMPLLTPSWVLSDWDFHVEGNEMYLGRETVSATAEWAGSGSVPILPFIRNYNVLVDLERGVLLLCSGLVDNHPAIVYSVGAVQFDVEIPAETFSFQLGGTTTLFGVAVIRLG